MAKMQPNRRQALATGMRGLGYAALGPSLLGVGGCGPAHGGNPIPVGILHSETGTMAISEISLRDAELLAIEEINAAGGVLGRPLLPVVEDGRSRFFDVFPKKAEKLLVKDEVAVVFGCWTSASRKAVIPVFEKYDRFLFYPLQYEGNESSRNVVYAGAAPNQQILPAVDWLLSPAGGARKRFGLIGSDYVFPRTAHFLVEKYLGKKGGGASVVCDIYAPFDLQEFGAPIKKLLAAKPDVILSTINGSGNLAFYEELLNQGVNPSQVPVVAMSVAEDELRGFLPELVKGHYAAWTYFQSSDRPENQAFVKRFREEYGPDRVVDDPIHTAYSQVFLWKAAVEKAGGVETERVRRAFHEGVEWNAPGGPLRIDPKNQHTFHRFRLGRIRSDRQFDIVFESSGPIEPDPYPQVAFPGWSCDWTAGGITAGPKVTIPGL